ncbi:short transient receptor potential channel 4-like [Glandiceps talaboti]
MENANECIAELYLSAAEKGDIHELNKALKSSSKFDINVKDNKGRSALQLAVENGRLEVVKILLSHSVYIEDSLLHAVDAKFGKAVELLLNNAGDEDILNSHASENNEDFHPDISPIILAAQHNDYHVIKMLVDKGAPPIELSDLHTEKHTVQRSVGTLNIYKALASEAYISFMENEKKEHSDPFGRAFELSAELKRMSSLEYEFRQEYLDLADQCETYAAELLGQTRDTDELRTVLNHESKGHAQSDRQTYLPSKVLYAVKTEQKKFVTHPYCQQELIERWYRGLPDLRDSSTIYTFFLSVLIVLLFPVLSMVYIIVPTGRFGRFMNIPYVKFLLHTASYLVFVVMLFLTTTGFTGDGGGCTDSEEDIAKTDEVSKIRSQQRGAIPSNLEIVIIVWIFGMVWREIKEVSDGGIMEYLSDTWNMFDCVQLGLYLSWIGLRIAAYLLVQGEKESHSHSERYTRDVSENLLNGIAERRITNSISQEHIDTRVFMDVALGNFAGQLLSNVSHIMESVKTSHQFGDELSKNISKSLTRLIDQFTNMFGTTPPPSLPFIVENNTFDDVAYSNSNKGTTIEWLPADPTLIAFCLMSCANVISVIRILRIVVINEYIGPLQISFSKMIADIIKFLFIFGVIWFAFALGMTQMYWAYSAEEKIRCLQDGGTERECGEQYFAGIGSSLMSLFWSLYGLIDLEVLNVDADHQSTEFFGRMLFAGYGVAAVVILLNLLIALMGTTYEAVVENSDTEWKFARSELWMDYFKDGATLPPPFNMVPTPHTIISSAQYVWNKTCAHRFGKELTWAPRKQSIVEDNYTSVFFSLTFQDVCKQLVLRYLAEKASIARESGEGGAFKEELMTIKQDMSLIRYEIYGIDQRMKGAVNYFDGKSDDLSENILLLKSDVKQNRNADHEELGVTRHELKGSTERGHVMLENLEQRIVGMQQQHSEQEERTKGVMSDILNELKQDIAKNKEDSAEMFREIQSQSETRSERENAMLLNLLDIISNVQSQMLENETSKLEIMENMQELSAKVDSLGLQAANLVREVESLKVSQITKPQGQQQDEEHKD